MTGHVLSSEVSYCSIDGELVLLDVNKDRYFRLPRPLEQALVAHQQGNDIDPTAIAALVDRKILVTRRGANLPNRKPVEVAKRSAMEMPLQRSSIRPRDLAEVSWTVWRVHRSLKAAPLASVLSHASAIRPAPHLRTPSEVCEEGALLDAAARFRRTRLYVPIEMRCLLDSVSLACFLSRRQFDPCVVFGVALDPFSAHCWVQVGDLVLNDSLGNVHAHTVIRVV